MSAGEGDCEIDWQQRSNAPRIHNPTVLPLMTVSPGEFEGE
jgi:hypothetical protein